MAVFCVMVSHGVCGMHLFGNTGMVTGTKSRTNFGCHFRMAMAFLTNLCLTLAVPAPSLLLLLICNLQHVPSPCVFIHILHAWWQTRRWR